MLFLLNHISFAQHQFESRILHHQHSKVKPPFPSLTQEWHNESYPAIDPSRPELSVLGKSVIITGGGAGIGSRIAESYAQAGAAKIALIGRRIDLLEKTKESLSKKYPKSKFTIHAADVVDDSALKKAASEIEAPWDILVLNAGYLATSQHIVKADVSDWWKTFEVNVKGMLLVLQAFAPTAKQHAAVIGVSSAVINFPGAMLQGVSAYTASKIAMTKMLEFFAGENPDMFVGIFHPGVIETDMYHKGKRDDMEVTCDDIALPANFAVWLSSKEAAFLRGKFVYANFDVDEMKAKASEIEGSNALTANIVGGPWG